jgi:hypothetical protein
MPGALAPDPRPVDTDPLHCFSSPRSATQPVGAESIRDTLAGLDP